ncbi:unnamed protein product [Macrosiphum euphorbiae]|uniref:Uncharacterized protein n=1 Tax=Macrosiphum euphorbiae TaxID=13131 RepID=A0AAV0VVU0_9HEMI|nr:unnamed protein product [Macrosiphum euphorbiae]
MDEFAVVSLLYLRRSVLISGDQVQGACIGKRDFLVKSILRLIFFFIRLKFSKIVVGVFALVYGKFWWKLEKDICFGWFEILIIYLIVLLSRMICRGGSPALHNMLATGLVLKEPVASLIPWL